MIKTKYDITNLGSSIILLSYQNFGDGIWVYQSTLLPGQTKHIWCNFGTLSYSGPSKNVKIIQLPTNVCGITPTSTPSITPTLTSTPTPTPSITPTLTSTPTPIPLGDLFGILIPDNDLYTEEILNPFFIHNEYVVCCNNIPVTLYSNDETIIVGSYLYTDTSLLIPFSGRLAPFSEGGYSCNTSSGVLTDNYGQVTDIPYVFTCSQ
jgi:hypothetical protein